MIIFCMVLWKFPEISLEISKAFNTIKQWEKTYEVIKSSMKTRMNPRRREREQPPGDTPDTAYEEKMCRWPLL